jgi:hypothetical protein
MKLNISIALLFALAPALAVARPLNMSHPKTPTTHMRTRQMHDRSPKPHLHTSQHFRMR